jgi:hypothetical protein
MAYVDPRLRGLPAPVVAVERMERENVARLDRMKGSELAFLDQRIPGYQSERSSTSSAWAWSRTWPTPI